MSTARVPPSAQVLAAHVGDGHPLPGALSDVEQWLAGSSRFRSFIDANRDKVRKKVRLATTDDARRDLLAELRVAALLVAERRIGLAFEAYGSGNRGPDFTGTFGGGQPFNLEVTRRRTGSADGLERTILGKLRQLPPSRANVLVLALDGHPQTVDLAVIMHEIRARIDRRDDAWIVAHGIDAAAKAGKGMLRLSAVIAWPTAEESWRSPTTWVNAGARVAIPRPTVMALATALSNAT